MQDSRKHRGKEAQKGGDHSNYYIDSGLGVLGVWFWVWFFFSLQSFQQEVDLLPTRKKELE